jgi:hypothetical protein
MKNNLSRLTAIEFNMGPVTLVFDTKQQNAITEAPRKGN